MKTILFILFLSLISCGVTKTNYMCGELPCINKKEFKEYFAKNLTIEIQTIKSKKNSSIDLVKLNTGGTIQKNKNTLQEKDSEKLNKKEQKALIKAEKIFLKQEERRIKIDKKNKIKEEKKLAKLRIKNKKKVTENNKTKVINEISRNAVKTPLGQKNQISEKKLRDKVSFESVKTENQLNLCENLIDCDIDKIADLLIKKGKNKNFPDITSR